MNPALLALMTASLYVVTILLLRFIGRTVPIVLIGLPVCLAGLATICAFSTLTWLAVAPGSAAAGGFIAFILSFVHGCNVAGATMTQALQDKDK